MTTVLWLLAPASPTAAAPARFWLSTSSTDPGAPAGASVDAVPGENRFVHIWAQPQTVGPGAFNDTLNPFKTLKNFSLNLKSAGPSSVVDFFDSSIVVHNPELSAPGSTQPLKRFQFVGDSSTMIASSKSASEVAGGEFDSVDRLQGFSLELEELDDGVATQFVGIGGACLPGDRFCVSTTTAGPAWLVASVEWAAVSGEGVGELFLQVGPLGINHAGESSSQTEVTFGSPTNPVYNAADDREVILPADSPDALTPTIGPASVAAWQGGDGVWATDNWQLSGPEPWPMWSSDAVLPANATVTVSANRKANSTLVQAGRLMVEQDASLAGDVDVEAGGMLGGGGGLAGNLTLEGALSIGDSSDGLLVLGEVNLLGAELKLAESYAQPPDTVSAPLTVLTAGLGVHGSFATEPGADLGGGFLLETLQVTGNAVIVSIRSPAAVAGDFDGDGQVGINDYNLWRQAFGTASSAADGNGDGLVDLADYTLWRDNLPASKPAVPEPHGLLGLAAAAACLAAAERTAPRRRSVADATSCRSLCPRCRGASRCG